MLYLFVWLNITLLFAGRRKNGEVRWSRYRARSEIFHRAPQIWISQGESHDRDDFSFSTSLDRLNSLHVLRTHCLKSARWVELLLAGASRLPPIDFHGVQGDNSA